MKIREILDERARLVKQTREIVKTADAEKRKISSEEQERLDVMYVEIERLTECKTLEERQQKVEAEELKQEQEARQNEDAVTRAKFLGKSDDEIQENRNTAFTKFLRYGIGGLNQEDRALVGGMHSQLPAEARALSVGTDSAGGYTVPTGFQNELMRALKAFGGVRQVARILPTDSGGDLDWPTVDDTGQTGALLTENSQVAEQDVTFSAVTLQSFMYTSKLVRVSFQLLQDNAIDIQSELASMLGERIGRITNTHFTTGDASSKPNGIVTAATDSTVALGAIPTVEKALDLIHKIEPAYRPNSKWMFNDLTFAQFRKTKTLDGTIATPEFAWQPALRGGEPDRLLGYEYVINQDMAAHSTTNKSVLFGDFSKYVIRDVGGAQLLRLQERYADFLQVGFIAFSRHDGDLVSGGNTAIAHASVS